MIDQSTDKKGDGIYSLALSSPFHYIRCDSIVDVITHGNRKFYTKFRRIEKPPSLEAISRHIRQSSDIYLPVYTQKESDRLILIHTIEGSEVFINTVKHLLSYIGKDYMIYIGRDDIQIHIITERQSIESLHKFGRDISEMLESRLQKSWQIYPDIDIPAEKNIYPLPIDEYIS